MTRRPQNLTAGRVETHGPDEARRRLRVMALSVVTHVDGADADELAELATEAERAGREARDELGLDAAGRRKAKA